MVGNLIAHQQVLTFANGVWWQWGVGVGPKPGLLSLKQHLHMARPLSWFCNARIGSAWVSGGHFRSMSYMYACTTPKFPESAAWAAIESCFNQACVEHIISHQYHSPK